MSSQPIYFFIRILEACNAGCDMCNFAFSKEPYRLDYPEFSELLHAAHREGIKYIRFTGGEPLLHTGIVAMIAAIHSFGIRTSIITNAAMLQIKLPALVDAGLDQVVISIDGADPSTHDRIRATPGLFDRAIAALRLARAAGLRTRVNTVCGPSNFREMPRLQALLSEIGVEQWELSSLKLERPLDYTPQDREDIEPIVKSVYIDAVKHGGLVPRGKVWCGTSAEERERYFSTGITPRPDSLCHVVHRVRYLDARRGWLFPCSLLPHRPDASTTATDLSSGETTLNSPAMEATADWYYKNGPNVCTGCSTTATDYSSLLHRGDQETDWAY